VEPNKATGPDFTAPGSISHGLLTGKVPGRGSPRPSQINALLPKGIDDIWDRMTQDSREERYESVDAILEDIEKLQGLEALLGRGSQIAVAESPLSRVKFREGSEEPVAGQPLDGEGEGDDDKKGGPGHRPYSFQQRRKKI